MSPLLEGIPIFERKAGFVSAEHYNTVQIALKRLSNSLRLEIPNLRTLDMIIDKDAWIVVDRSLNDIPIIAWTNFDVEQRENLHQPVSCDILSYHQFANVIVAQVMEAKDTMICEQLAERLPADDGKKVLEFKHDEKTE